MSGLILGVSAYHRDSAAVLLRDGEIVAAAQEQWFTRKLDETRFPSQAIAYCLQEIQIALADIDCVVFYTTPHLTTERLLEAYRAHVPRAVSSLLSAVPQWLHETLPLKIILKKELAAIGAMPGKVLVADYRRAMAGDAGGALGAALSVWHEHLSLAQATPIEKGLRSDVMCGGYLGPWFASDSIAEYLDSVGAPYRRLDDPEFYAELSRALAADKVVGWLQGRMPFGIRGCAARAVIGDPRSAKMASAVWAPVAAVDANARLNGLLDAFEAKTGRRDLASTAFNAPDEPMVCTPADAYRCFMRTGIDCLALEDIVLHKREQPLWEEE